MTVQTQLMKSIIQCLTGFCLLTLASQAFAQEADEQTELQFTYFDEVGDWDTDLIDRLITKADFILVHHSHNVLTMGSMNFIERELQGLTPDILLAGINGSRLGLYNYDERLVRVTGNPPIIIPTHWDSFAQPYEFSQQSNVDQKLIPFRDTVAEISPNSRVVIPVHLEPFVVD